MIFTIVLSSDCKKFTNNKLGDLLSTDDTNNHNFGKIHSPMMHAKFKAIFFEDEESMECIK